MAFDIATKSPTTKTSYAATRFHYTLQRLGPPSPLLHPLRLANIKANSVPIDDVLYWIGSHASSLSIKLVMMLKKGAEELTTLITVVQNATKSPLANLTIHYDARHRL